MAPIYAAQAPFTAFDFGKIILFGFLCAVLQSSVLSWLGFSGYGPEWILIVTIFTAIRAELWIAALAALILGLIRDAVGGGFLGLYQLTLIIQILGFHFFKGRLNFNSPPMFMALIFILSLAGSLLVMTPVMAVLGWPSDSFNPLPAFLSTAFTSALAAPIVFWALKMAIAKKEKD